MKIAVLLEQIRKNSGIKKWLGEKRIRINFFGTKS